MLVNDLCFCYDFFFSSHLISSHLNFYLLPLSVSLSRAWLEFTLERNGGTIKSIQSDRIQVVGVFQRRLGVVDRLVCHGCELIQAWHSGIGSNLIITMAIHVLCTCSLRNGLVFPNALASYFDLIAFICNCGCVLSSPTPRDTPKLKERPGIFNQISINVPSIPHTIQSCDDNLLGSIK